MLFVYPNLMLQTSFPLATSIFSAILKQNGYDVDIFDTTFYRTEEKTSDEKRVENLQIARFSLDGELNKLRSKEQMFEDLAQKIEDYRPNLLPFFCQNRAEVINEETVRYLVEMNCHSCAIGIEHGNEEFRFKMLNRKVSNTTYLHAIECLKKTEIKVSLNNILGFPDETRELVFDTISLNRIFNRRYNVYQINAYYYTPYHGTALRQYCVDRGYISKDAQTSYITNDTVLNMPSLSTEQIRGLVRTFTLYVRFPKERYPEIAVAERLDEEGNRKFKELQLEYWDKYLR